MIGNIDSKIEYLRVENFRSLQDFSISHVLPLTVLIGDHGSGKSTVLDVLSFLHECVESGLNHAWNKRFKLEHKSTQGNNKPVKILIRYRESGSVPATYILLLNECPKRGPFVVEEHLSLNHIGHLGMPLTLFHYRNGQGRVIKEMPSTGKKEEYIEIPLQSSNILALNEFGQHENIHHPAIASLHKFIKGFYISRLSIDNIRLEQKISSCKKLSESGDNLVNVIRHLEENHNDRLEHISRTLNKYVPNIENILTDITPNGRLSLKIKEKSFDQPISAKYLSDGTLKILAYLTLLYGSEHPSLICAENVPDITEEYHRVCHDIQLLLTTQSPLLLNKLNPEQVQILSLDEHGYTKSESASRNIKIKKLIENGALLGDLWIEKYLEMKDCLPVQDENTASSNIYKI